MIDTQLADTTSPQFLKRQAEVAAIVAPIMYATGREWPAEQFIPWTLALGDLADDAIRIAVARWLQASGLHSENAGFPMPGDVRALARQAVVGRLPDADECFAELMAAKGLASEYDNDRTRRAEAALHPLTQTVLRAVGGWPAVWNLKTGDRGIFAGQFRKAYESAARRMTERLVVSKGLLPAVATAADIAADIAAAIEGRPVPGLPPSNQPAALAQKVAAKLGVQEAPPHPRVRVAARRKR